MFSKVFQDADQQRGSSEGLNSKSRIIAYGAGLMMREERFAKAGTVVPLHCHYHEQITHVCKGSIKVIDHDGNETILKAEEAVYCAPNEMHSVIILEDDTVVKDAFTPVRLDHLQSKACYEK